jgi:mannose-6-phosphate isomerase-like protein (cupin superfamily)
VSRSDIVFSKEIKIMTARDRFLMVSTAALSLAGFAASADKPAPVTYMDHEKAAAIFEKGGSIARASDYTLGGVRRAKAGQVEVHDKETDLIYITDGEATFVTGGTMAGGKESKPGQWLGDSIQGGESHHVMKGDVIVVPAGTPHWFKEVPSAVSYMLVKVIQP